jgi:hypothetical protein
VSEWDLLTHNYAVICLALERARREVERLEKQRDEILPDLEKAGSRTSAAGDQ